MEGLAQGHMVVGYKEFYQHATKLAKMNFHFIHSMPSCII